jgi:DNA polymerase III delta subunit
MLLLLHGDNTVLSRAKLNQYLQDIKKKGIKDVVSLAGKKAQLTELIEAVETQSLFGTDRAVVIEELHAHKSKTTLKELVEYLSKLDHSAEVLLWEQKVVTAIQLKKLANFKAEVFKTSPVVFKFLDAIGTTTKSQTLSLYQEAVEKDSAEFIFFMLARHTRQLVQVTDPHYDLPPWQAGKLKGQLRALGEEKAKNFHSRLHEIDWHNKSGQSIHGVEGDLALLIASL